MDRLFDPEHPDAFAAGWLEAKGLTAAADYLRAAGRHPRLTPHVMEA